MENNIQRQMGKEMLNMIEKNREVKKKDDIIEENKIELKGNFLNDAIKR